MGFYLQNHFFWQWSLATHQPVIWTALESTVPTSKSPATWSGVPWRKAGFKQMKISGSLLISAARKKPMIRQQYLILHNFCEIHRIHQQFWCCESSLWGLVTANALNVLDWLHDGPDQNARSTLCFVVVFSSVGCQIAKKKWWKKVCKQLLKP